MVYLGQYMASFFTFEGVRREGFGLPNVVSTMSLTSRYVIGKTTGARKPSNPGRLSSLAVTMHYILFQSPSSRRGDTLHTLAFWHIDSNLVGGGSSENRPRGVRDEGRYGLLGEVDGCVESAGGIDYTRQHLQKGDNMINKIPPAARGTGVLH